MGIVFVEYKVGERHLETYKHWTKELEETDPRVEFYEGTDQPGLFVELWKGLSREQVLALKSERLAEVSPQEQVYGRWVPLHEWVPGGTAKIHIWPFQKVR